MTVGAVNGVYQYTYDYVNQYFNVNVSNARINELMQEFGILPTGNQEEDLRALFNAMYNYYSQQAPVQNNPNTPVPWAPLMQKVGLTPTGDLATDHSAFMVRIDQLQGIAKNGSQEDTTEELVNQSYNVFIPPAKQIQQSPSYDDVVGTINMVLLGLYPGP
ncbi:MAG TPA: hypothetical protein PLG15_06615 [Candidatus Gastranaerophilaceae bacterium]|nr:hypothetical protein [Candidatus Gastranaerophilaceae bacterium]HPT42039.1 hypothetical protein [Candidatus Gastranaerophilaceae bacterium]